jgi:PAS domain S-box-containing protein
MDDARIQSFEDLPLQVWTALPDGRLDYVNAFTCAYFGMDRHRILEDGWKDVCHSFDLIGVAQRWRECLASGEDYEVRFRLLRGSDRIFRWHLGRAVAVRDDAGAIAYWLGCNTDIDRLEREHELSLAAALRRGDGP